MVKFFNKPNIFLLFLLFFFNTTLFSLPAVQSVKATKSRPILYFVKTPKWYLVLEKVDLKNYDKWLSFIMRQEEMFNSNLTPCIKKFFPNIKGFERIKLCLKAHKTLNSYDFYIVYITTQSPEILTEEQKFGSPSSKSSIKMVIGVQVNKELPYYSPFGITRTVDEAIRISENPAPSESNLMTIEFFSYLYCAMKHLYPQINSILTSSVLQIRRLNQKYLPAEAITIGKTLEHLSMPWKTKDTFVYDHEHDVNYFQGPVLLKVNGQAYIDYLEKAK